MKKIYYIETTLNGYIFKRIPICDFIPGKDYIGDLVFYDEECDEEINFYEDLAGDMDELDAFLKRGSHSDCEDYDNELGTKKNVYMEYWQTNVLGYFEDRFVGLQIEEEDNVRSN